MMTALAVTELFPRISRLDDVNWSAPLISLSIIEVLPVTLNSPEIVTAEEFVRPSESVVNFAALIEALLPLIELLTI